MSDKVHLKMSPVALGLAFGITWALGVLFVGIMALYIESYGAAFINSMGSIYMGYEATFLGAIIGTVYAFFDGFIGGVIFALIYNCCIKCTCRKSNQQ